MNDLIDKFFEGETTCAEERMLFGHFANGRKVDDRHEKLRDMMQWYASLAMNHGVTAIVSERRRLTERISHWIAAAAAVAIVATVALTFVMRQSDDERLMAQYVGSYIVKDGVKHTDIETIYPQLRHAEQLVEANEREVERRINAYINSSMPSVGDYVDSDNPVIMRQVETLFTN